jgi:hypothetical protein
MLIKQNKIMEMITTGTFMENAQNGIEIVIEPTARYFSAWDFSKAM